MRLLHERTAPLRSAAAVAAHSLEVWPPFQVKPYYNPRGACIQQLLAQPVHLVSIVRITRHTMERQLQRRLRPQLLLLLLLLLGY
jgi:hypothetical protein